MKFLCALSAGKIIVNVKWLDDSKKAGKFVDEKKYLLKDPKTEKQYGFTLAKSCKRAQDHTQPPIFAGLTFYATSSVMPRPEELKDILEAAGAKWSKSPPPKTPVDDFVVIGHQADAKELASLIDAGWIVHSNEFVLTGLLRMEVDYQSHILELEDKSTSKKTSSTPGRATPAARKKRK
ncbi:uncharacterized protein EV422DRAFT_96788 [Fimicolochytrium jonesii]|uniref:uncharacterized protein n=1 Tax=Fimicolochytrium jonesii TaxID=1396493 RepID=UPI0022FF0785|nr:uncharacterized protein EV422DRAFT_96788 [Fimicolochytrium jonesii]KAI8819553.1 hypothetical protein EV422DRAFT_96788 [Fimicolochytrium jonesii]